MLRLQTCLLVTLDHTALTLIYKLGGKSDFDVKPTHTHTKKEKNKTEISGLHSDSEN